MITDTRLGRFRKTFIKTTIRPHQLGLDFHSNFSLNLNYKNINYSEIS